MRIARQLLYALLLAAADVEREQALRALDLAAHRGMLDSVLP